MRSVFPYRLAWRWLLSESEAYIGALEHEAFHASQGQVAPAQLARAETAMQHDPNYSWDDRALRAAWQQNVAAQHLFAAQGFRLLHQVRWYASAEETY